MFGRTVQTASKKINAGGVEKGVRGQGTANQNKSKSTKNLTLSNMLNDAERILIHLPHFLLALLACMYICFKELCSPCVLVHVVHE